ncbi:hypothetical protein LJC11_01440 [Bacteroidales bacterium OttesenSCG-928-I21]|nr:hypothetical protein [Bacteroidales bacterium OttesenSCG-928-I21]
MKQGKDDKSLTLTRTIREYIDLRLEHLQLKFSKKISILVGNIVFMIFLAILGLALLLSIYVLIYELLMTWIGIAWVVSLIGVAITCLIIVSVWLFKEKLIIRPIANIIIRSIMEEQEEKEEEHENEEHEK